MWKDLYEEYEWKCQHHAVDLILIAFFPNPHRNQAIKEEKIQVRFP